MCATRARRIVVPGTSSLGAASGRACGGAPPVAPRPHAPRAPCTPVACAPRGTRAVVPRADSSRPCGHGRDRLRPPSPISPSPPRRPPAARDGTVGDQGRGAARDRGRAGGAHPGDPRGQRARPGGRARERALGRADGPAGARRRRACARSPPARGRSPRCRTRSARSWTAGAWRTGSNSARFESRWASIAVVYEARPNVTIDAAALALKSGNAVLLRGSSCAAHSNAVLARIASEAAPRPAGGRDRPRRRRPGGPDRARPARRDRRPDHPARRRGPEEGDQRGREGAR